MIIVNYDYYREELNRIQNELDGTDDKTKVKLLTSSKINTKVN